MAEQQQATPDSRFRAGLEDVIAVLEKLVPLCESPDDLIAMLQLALKNDGQLKLLMNRVSPLSMSK